MKRQKRRGSYIDLAQINGFTVIDSTQKVKKRGSHISINSHFHFSSLTQDYSFIDITVTTQCFNDRIFGTGEVVSKIYTLPFREKFPIMAVTPKEVFVMDVMNHRDWRNERGEFLRRQRKREKQDFHVRVRERKAYTSSCIYQVTLTNRHNQENNIKLQDQFYHIEWNNTSHGVSYAPLDSHKSISPFPDKNQGPIRKQFLRLEDIDKNRAGYLNFNFFDIVNDRAFPIEGYKVDSMILECYSGKHKDGSVNSTAVVWPYNIPNNSISLKTLFLNSDIRSYIMTNTLAVCRLILYEKDLLRYFSREMKITI